MNATWKTVRVFISSTFHDMQAERDHLVHFVFPRLRRKQSDCGEIVAVGESDESRRFVGEIKTLEERLELNRKACHSYTLRCDYPVMSF